MTALTSSNLIERIGNTPVIELKSFSTKNVRFYAKLEWYNPYGSVKDRAALLDDQARREGGRFEKR